MRMADLAENQRRFANQYTKWDTLSPWSQYTRVFIGLWNMVDKKGEVII